MNASIKPQYILFDAKGRILGRMSTEIARTLSGRTSIEYEPNVGGKDWVIIINSDKVRLSGEKGKKKLYWKHSGYPGSIKSATFNEMMEKDSRKVIKHAVEGMMPKNKLSQAAMKRLRVFKDEKHPYGKKIGDNGDK